MDPYFILPDTVTLGLFLLFVKLFGGELPSMFSSRCPWRELSSLPCVSSVKGDQSSGSSTGECGVGGVTPCSSDRLSRVGSVFGDGSLER